MDMTRISSSSPVPASGLRLRSLRAFTLIEVVLAIGVLSLAVVAMLGLFAPTMNSVKQVVDGNKATALVGMINAQVNERMSYEDIGLALYSTAEDDSSEEPPRIMYFFAWEREDGNGNIDIVMSMPGRHDESPKGADLDGNGTADVASPDADKSTDNLVGTAFVVTFEHLKLGTGNYQYANYDSEAYIPFLVTIYQYDPDAGFDPDKLDETNRVISYPSAKLR